MEGPGAAGANQSCRLGSARLAQELWGHGSPSWGLPFLPRAPERVRAGAAAWELSLVLAPGMLWDSQRRIQTSTVPEHPQPAAPVLLTAQ